MANDENVFEQDADWFKSECKLRGITPSDDEIEYFCEKVAFLLLSGGYKFDYQARQTAFDEIQRKKPLTIAKGMVLIDKQTKDLVVVTGIYNGFFDYERADGVIGKCDFNNNLFELT